MEDKEHDFEVQLFSLLDHCTVIGEYGCKKSKKPNKTASKALIKYRKLYEKYNKDEDDHKTCFRDAFKPYREIITKGYICNNLTNDDWLRTGDFKIQYGREGDVSIYISFYYI